MLTVFTVNEDVRNIQYILCISLIHIKATLLKEQDFEKLLRTFTAFFYCVITHFHTPTYVMVLLRVTQNGNSVVKK